MPVLSENLALPERLCTYLCQGAVLLFLAACGAAPTASGIEDPMEAQNREIHAFNKALDRAILKPLSGAGSDGASPIREGVSNVARNLDAPGDVINGLLQGRPHHALENTFRFVLNSTVGLGGLFDPASAMGITGRETDFGETLHVWGMGEGNFVELPILGPSTERDLVGMIVDRALNPLSFVLPRAERNAATVIGLAGRIGDRGRYSETVDSILYESADSYAQARLIYLQNRRFELDQGAGGPALAEDVEPGFIDPYEDPYGN